MTGDFPEGLRSQYESLRAGALARNSLACQPGLGYSVLARKGLASWMQAWIKFKTVVPPLPAPSPVNNRLSSTEEVVSVLTEMALRVVTK